MGEATGNSADNDAFLAALVEEAMKKSSLCWLRYADTDHAVWHVWHEGAAYLVSGGTEQHLPDIDTLCEVTVIARTKSTRQRVLAWRARVETIRPDQPEWSEVADLLLAQRLNLSDPATTKNVWAAQCVTTRLVPTGAYAESPDALPAYSHAAHPVPTSATTRGPLPRVMHKRQSHGPGLS